MVSTLGPRPAKRRAGIISRMPLEDMRELWYWGPWKELVPSGFDTAVVVVCTSREKCLVYAGIQTHDDWLLDGEEDGGAAAGEQQRPGDRAREDLFDDEGRASRFGRRFCRVSFHELIELLAEELRGHPQRGRGPTLVVNPRKSSDGRLAADGFWRVQEFLREVEAGLAPKGHEQE